MMMLINGDEKSIRRPDLQDDSSHNMIIQPTPWLDLQVNSSYTMTRPTRWLILHHDPTYKSTHHTTRSSNLHHDPTYKTTHLTPRPDLQDDSSNTMNRPTRQLILLHEPTYKTTHLTPWTDLQDDSSDTMNRPTRRQYLMHGALLNGWFNKNQERQWTCDLLQNVVDMRHRVGKPHIILELHD